MNWTKKCIQRKVNLQEKQLGDLRQKLIECEARLQFAEQYADRQAKYIWLLETTLIDCKTQLQVSNAHQAEPFCTRCKNLHTIRWRLIDGKTVCNMCYYKDRRARSRERKSVASLEADTAPIQMDPNLELDQPLELPLEFELNGLF